MSADNWGVCPRCLDRAKERLAVLTKAAEDAYGTADRDTYEQLAEVAKAAADEFSEDEIATFREDYEVWGACADGPIRGGAVHVDYTGECSVCGLKTAFTGAQPFYDRTTQ